MSDAARFILPGELVEGFYRDSWRDRLRRVLVCNRRHRLGRNGHGPNGRTFCESCEVKSRPDAESYFDVIERVHAWYDAHPKTPRGAPVGSVGESLCVRGCGWRRYGDSDSSAAGGPSTASDCLHEWGPFRLYDDALRAPDA